MAVRELRGAWNFRDVADFLAHVRRGDVPVQRKLSRLDDAGRATLRRLGITDTLPTAVVPEVARAVRTGSRRHRRPAVPRHI